MNLIPSELKHKINEESEGKIHLTLEFSWNNMLRLPDDKSEVWVLNYERESRFGEKYILRIREATFYSSKGWYLHGDDCMPYADVRYWVYRNHTGVSLEDMPLKNRSIFEMMWLERLKKLFWRGGVIMEGGHIAGIVFIVCATAVIMTAIIRSSH